MPSSKPLQLSRAQKIELIALIEEKERRTARRSILKLYPDSGPLRRELYAKHMQFFRLGAQVRSRCFMAANRIGKTMGAGGYELTTHLTGQYPEWWEGK